MSKLFGKDYWWNLVIVIEEKREQVETRLPNVDDETYEEYVLLTNLLGPLYKYLTEGEL